MGMRERSIFNITYLYEQAVKAFLLVFLFVAYSNTTAVSINHEQDNERWTRLQHAKELLGNTYKKSVVRKGEKVDAIYDFILEKTSERLRPEWKQWATQIANTIISESRNNHFDPIFIMAVIEAESGFNPNAQSYRGAIGLMQVMPNTGEWLAKKMDIPWEGEKSLHDPITNIRIGSAYLAELRAKFEADGRLYLAAYNMGSANLRKAIGRQIRPKDYPVRVMTKYIQLYTDATEGVY
jgi:soluble lytic murein transglycosylase